MNKRLKAARIAAGFSSATAAIDAFKWNSSKYRAHENGQNNYNAADAIKYAQAYNVSSGWLLTGENSQYSHQISAPTKRKPPNPVTSDTSILMGYVEEGAWRELSFQAVSETDLNDKIFLSDENYPRSVQFDLKIIDDSVDGVAVRGDYVRCIASTINDLSQNDLAVIEYRHKENMKQFIIRRLNIIDNEYELIPERLSIAQAQSGIIRVAKNPCSNDMRIIGKVIFQYRPV